MEALNVRVEKEMTDLINQMVSETGLSKSTVLRHIVAQGLLAVEGGLLVRGSKNIRRHIRDNQTLSDFK